MKFKIKEIVLVALFAGLTAVGAFISIPLGPVPITLQTLFVILGGVLLGAKLGALAQIVYILLGLIGLPIFSGFIGGPQAIVRPSFGFLIGFIFAAFIVGKIVERDNSRFKIWLAAIFGTIVIYIFGLPYMYYILNVVLGKGLPFTTILKTGLLLFIPGDIVKLILASVVGVKILPIITRHKN